MKELKDKLYNAEVDPPSNTWSRIEEALDEAHVGSAFPSTLENLEIAAPPAAWENISAILDADKSTYADKLYQLEVVPPVSSWDIIEATLPAKEATVQRMPAFIKWAVAALFIGAAAFAIIRFSANSSDNAKGLADKLVDSSMNKTTETGSIKNDNTDQSIRNNVLTPVSPTIAAVLPLKTEKRKARSTQVSNDKASYTYKTNGTTSKALSDFDEGDENVADRYVMLLTPNGNFIRMSKKWGELICCVSGEDGDPDCKSELKKWQEKIADAPVTPAPGNFMDILDLVNTLNESAEL